MAHKMMERRLSAIVAADMVGFSRLMQLDEAGTLARQKACQTELILPNVNEFGGRLVKTTGDGVLLEFPSAVNAVLCAVAVQRGVATREADIPVDRRIQYRVGINLGEIVIDGEDIFGDGVNIAARLEASADPGGVRISEAVFNNVKGKLDVGFADLGPQKVKNISEPVPTYEVLLDSRDVGKVVGAKVRMTIGLYVLVAGMLTALVIAIGGFVFWDRSPRPPSVPTEKRLLVLPLQAEGDNAKVFANGASENFWLSFVRLKGLTMVPRSMAIKFLGIDLTPDQFHQLGEVTHVLDGRVAFADENVTVFSRLQHYLDGERIVIWEKRVEGPAGKAFELLAQLKSDVVASMNVPLNPTERKIIQNVPTRSMDAYLLFTEAYLLHQKGHWNDQKKVILAYQQAMRIDPLFIDAQTEYAWANYNIWFQGWNIVRNTLEAKAEAERIIDGLLKADQKNAEAQALMASIRLMSGDPDGALAVVQGAVFRNGDDPNLRVIHSHVLIALARYKEARAELEKAIELSPRFLPREIRSLSWNFLRLGDADRALSLLGQLNGEDAKNPHVYGQLAEAYTRTGEIEKAQANARKLIQQWPTASLVWLRDTIFDQYKDPAIYEAYARAMLKAGIPEWPLDYDRGRDSEQLRNAELVGRFGGVDYRIIDGEDPFGQPFQMTLAKDGSVKMTIVWIPGTEFDGRWEIKSDELCFQFPAWARGNKFCDRVYMDREKSTNNRPRYVRLNNFGLFKFALEKIDD